MIRERYKSWAMTVLFFLALAANIWLMQRSFLYRDNVNTSQATTPDAFMTNMAYISFNAKGEWNNRLNAVRVTHYIDQDTSMLEMPKMVSRSDLLTWIITSTHGTARQGLKNIHLLDQVQVDRIHATKGKTLTLLTSELTAYPQEKFVQTDQPVTIIQPGSTVYATGLTANMNTGDVYLLSKVKGNYEKPSS